MTPNWEGTYKTYRKAASGAGTGEVLYPPSTRADDWSSDGRYLIQKGSTGGLWVAPLFGDRQRSESDRRRHSAAFQFLPSELHKIQARISPDSRWLAYVTDRTGRNEVYVTSFPTAGAQTQISTGGGTLPAWSPDGKELFFLGPDRKLMAAAVKAGSRLEPGIPKPLLEVRFSASAPNTPRFDVSCWGLIVRRFKAYYQRRPLPDPCGTLGFHHSIYGRCDQLDRWD
jgi:hypothetical protein